MMCGSVHVCLVQINSLPNNVGVTPLNNSCLLKYPPSHFVDPLYRKGTVFEKDMCGTHKGLGTSRFIDMEALKALEKVNGQVDWSRLEFELELNHGD